MIYGSYDARDQLFTSDEKKSLFAGFASVIIIDIILIAYGRSIL